MLPFAIANIFRAQIIFQFLLGIFYKDKRNEKKYHKCFLIGLVTSYFRFISKDSCAWENTIRFTNLDLQKLTDVCQLIFRSLEKNPFDAVYMNRINF